MAVVAEAGNRTCRGWGDSETSVVEFLPGPELVSIARIADSAALPQLTHSD